MPIGAEFASFDAPPPDSSFDSWLSQGTDNSNAFGSPSSVDWSRPDAPAAHGSGKNVELPSEQEYDSWLQNLSLGTGGTSEPRPSFESGGTGQFGDTSFMVDSGPFEQDSPSPSSKVDGSYQPSESPSWGNEASPEPPVPSRSQQSMDRGFSSGVDDLDSLRAKASPPAFGSPFGSFGNEPAEEEMRFDFDDDTGDNDQEYASVFGGEPGRAPAGKTTDYYQYIPTDIEALDSGGGARGFLTTGGVIVLGLLNLIAVVFLLMGLVG